MRIYGYAQMRKEEKAAKRAAREIPRAWGFALLAAAVLVLISSIH